MQIRPATADDCLAIAELAQMAGDNIPGHFWAESQQPGQSLLEAGAASAASETANFSYRNATLACIDDEVAGMLLAYRLPSAIDNTDDPAEFPDFVQPMIVLEQAVADSYYINMLAAYPKFRGRGAGSALLGEADDQARNAGCDLVSIMVFAQNSGATRLYLRHGFTEIERRPMVASAYLPAGDILLLTRPVT